MARWLSALPLLSWNKKTQEEIFKTKLWSNISQKCYGGKWSYSRDEKRLFLLLLFFLVSLTLLYFNDYRTELKAYRDKFANLSSRNAEQMQKLESVNVPVQTP